MKELFTNPEIEIYKLTCADVVCTSIYDGTNVGEDEDHGEYDF